MSEEPKALKLVFAPGCFDSFEGTQEELNELMADIQASFDNGDMLSNGTAVDLDDMSDEDIEAILNAAGDSPRQLQ